MPAAPPVELRLSRLRSIALRYPRKTNMLIKMWIILLVICAANIIFAADDSAAVHGGNGVVLPPPPPTKVEAVTETVQGVTITDPYRWLEDAKSPATREWLNAQMKYTEDYLSQVKVRPEIVKRLTEL